MSNTHSREAERLADRFDDGSEKAGTLALVEAILAVAAELERPGSVGELEDRTGDLSIETTDLKRRVADLELAMRALAPTVDLSPAETRQRLERLELGLGKVCDRIEFLEGGDT